MSPTICLHWSSAVYCWPGWLASFRRVYRVTAELGDVWSKQLSLHTHNKTFNRNFKTFFTLVHSFISSYDQLDVPIKTAMNLYEQMKDIYSRNQGIIIGHIALDKIFRYWVSIMITRGFNIPILYWEYFFFRIRIWEVIMVSGLPGIAVPSGATITSRSEFGLISDGWLGSMYISFGRLSQCTWVLKVSGLEIGHTRYCSTSGSDPLRQSSSLIWALSLNLNHHHQSYTLNFWTPPLYLHYSVFLSPLFFKPSQFLSVPSHSIYLRVEAQHWIRRILNKNEGDMTDWLFCDYNVESDIVFEIGK